jgi:hypothetical protein
MPERIQMRRTKGWKMPPNTVYVGRPSRWGNPWKIGDQMYDPALKEFRRVETRADAVQAFRQKVDYDPDEPWWDAPTEGGGWMTASGGYDDNIHVNRRSIRRFLAGKNLACWCPLGQPCHADVLLELANAPVSPNRNDTPTGEVK